MGGGYYSGDVARQNRSSNQGAFNYQGYGTDADAASSRREVHPLLNPHGQIRECLNTTPIVVALDVTRSRGDDSKIMYEKLPMFIGQIELKGYADGPAMSFCAIGDAEAGDSAPLQISQFEADNRLDEALSKFWLEEGGGGTGQESYELAAYYYAHRTDIAANKEGRKGYFFFVGDEGFYPTVSKKHVEEVLGHKIKKDLDSKQVFQELQEKFHVFFIYPQKSWEERKADIDAEIKQRVEAAGGQYKNVDIRASLLWNNRNDLDLHVIAPSGEEIFYNHKQSACGGWLDVDMNVQGESLKPVENVRWTKGSAPKGRYKVIVQNYDFHEKKHEPTKFRMEIEVNGDIKHIDGIVSPKGETGGPSNVTVYEFDYKPGERKLNPKEEAEKYAGYDDTLIKNQWSDVILPENILLIDEPDSIVDVMLGAMALVSGSSNLDTFMEDMKEREQSEERRNQTARALQNLSSHSSHSSVQVDGSLPDFKGDQERGGGSRRL